MGAAFAASKIIGFFGDAVGAASDLGETTSKVSVVFGDAADEVFALGKTSATALGLSENAALSAAGTYGNLFRAMGISTTESAKMSTGLVRLAADLGSFNNMDPTEVLDKLRAGLSGETEPLRALGVNLNAARIQAKAFEMGLASTTAGLTPAVKAQATYALILEDTTLAQGDFARTSGGLANQQRMLAAEAANLSAAIGGILLPVIVTLAQFGNNVLVPAIYAIGTGLGKLIEGIAFLSPGIVAIGTLIGLTLVPAFIAWAVAAGAAAVATIVAMGPVLVPIAAVAAAILGVTLAFNGLGGVVENFAMDFGEQGATVHRLADATGVDFNVMKESIQASMDATGLSFEETVAQMETDALIAKHGITDAMSEGVRFGAEAIRLGGPVVAAEAGKVAGMLPAEIKARDAEIRAAAYNNIVAFAAGVLDAQDKPKVAMDALLKAQEEALTRAEEIAYLKGQLASTELAAGLNDERPAVSLAAQAVVTEATTRLTQLGVEGYGKGTAGAAGVIRGLTGGTPAVGVAAARLRAVGAQNMDMGTTPGAHGANAGARFGTGIGSQYGYVNSKAAGVASGARAPLAGLGSQSYGWGSTLSANFLAGMTSYYGRIAAASRSLGAAAAVGIQLRSPAKEGPLSDPGVEGGWGRKLGMGLEAGMLRSIPGLREASKAMAGAMIPMPALRPSAAVSSVLGGPGGLSGSGGSVLNGGLTINVNAPNLRGDSASLEQLGRDLATQIRMRLPG